MVGHRLVDLTKGVERAAGLVGVEVQLAPGVEGGVVRRLDDRMIVTSVWRHVTSCSRGSEKR